jgi:hypothetical protein
MKISVVECIELGHDCEKGSKDGNSLFAPFISALHFPSLFADATKEL